MMILIYLRLFLLFVFFIIFNYSIQFFEFYLFPKFLKFYILKSIFFYQIKTFYSKTFNYFFILNLTIDIPNFFKLFPTKMLIDSNNNNKILIL